MMIPYGRHHLEEDDIQAVVAQLRSGTLTQGETVERFERALADYVGARYAVAVNSGTAALHLACAAAGLGSGDNVVTSAITFVASANCAVYVGATPHFVDIDPANVNMSPSDLDRRCSDLGSVSAIVPVHFAGLPCDMEGISRIAHRYNAVVIEDAAHALGSRYACGRRVGSGAYSALTAFSFHPVKSITTGEGGMITTNDTMLYRKLLRLRSHGINKSNDAFLAASQAYTDGKANRWYYEMQELGFNYRLTDIQAALGLSQLSKLDRLIDRRRYLALRYDDLLAATGIAAAQTEGRERSAHHLYVIRAPFGKRWPDRNAVMQRLFDSGIVTQVHYIPVPMHPFYRALGHVPERYPNALSYYGEALSIPLFFGLADDQQDVVARRLVDLSS